MTYPETIDSNTFPALASSLPLVVARNIIHRHYPSHRHDVLEFSLVVAGEGTEWVNGAPHRMIPGTVSFIQPYQFHEIVSTGTNPLTLLNCMFGLEVVSTFPLGQGHDRSLIDRFMMADAPEPSVIILSASDHPRMLRLFTDLFHEFNQQGMYREALLKLKLLEMLIHYERSRPLHKSTLAVPLPSQYRLAQQMLLFLHQNYREDISLELMSQHFHMSQAYLCAVIRQYTGKSFLALLHEIRVRHASSLLLTTDLAMNDIAIEAGFRSVKTFFRVFKQLRDVTPHRYRTAQKNDT